MTGWKRIQQEKRHLCTIFKLYTNSFCRQRAGLKVLIKVTLTTEIEQIFLEKIFLEFFLEKTLFFKIILFEKKFLPWTPKSPSA